METGNRFADFQEQLYCYYGFQRRLKESTKTKLTNDRWQDMVEEIKKPIEVSPFSLFPIFSCILLSYLTFDYIYSCSLLVFTVNLFFFPLLFSAFDSLTLDPVSCFPSLLSSIDFFDSSSIFRSAFDGNLKLSVSIFFHLLSSFLNI